MTIFARQFKALVHKNWLVNRKNWLINLVRCVILPVLYILFVAEAQHFFQTTGQYGVGTKFRDIKPLNHALIGKQKFLWIDQSANATLAKRLITDITSALPTKQVLQVANRTQLAVQCPENFNEVSQCFGAVVFQTLNYTDSTRNFVYQLRLDNGLYSTNVYNGLASLEAHHFPIQWAVDSAIFREVFGNSEVPPVPQEVPFTQITQTERVNGLRLSFVRGTREITALAFFVGFVGVIYHLVGFMSAERELLLTELLDVMGCSPVARLLSWHLSFDAFYFLSWIFSAVIIQQLVFTTTNGAIVIIFHILFGLALVSWSTFVAVFFKQAQLSGIVSTIAAVVLAILAMVGKDAFGNVGIPILSILFPPMSFIFGYILFCDFERYGRAVDMTSTYGQHNSTMIAIFICLVIDIFLFAILALYAEHLMFGAGNFFQKTSERQTNDSSEYSLELRNLTKIFKPFSLRRKEPFYAVQDLSLQIRKGEIFCLLGANGSGKSTTLGMIAGSLSTSAGDVLVNGHSRQSSRFPPGLLSLCPQKNILWRDLTVLEHVQTWSQIKSADDRIEDVEALIESCDLSTKLKAESSTLSGGMMRKLQLAIAFCGQSEVVLIDEVSSGIDPLARRKLHDIILDGRATRTQILTTHFLDEADLLADRIALLSKGCLRSQGVPLALKDKLGKGYVLNIIGRSGETINHELFRRLKILLPMTTMKTVSHCENEYRLPTNQVSRIRSVLHEIETNKSTWGVESYDINGPRLEDVFLTIMEEANTDELPLVVSTVPPYSAGSTNESIMDLKDGSMALQPIKGTKHKISTMPLIVSEESSVDFAQLALSSGRQTTVWEQVLSQLRKRWTIARRNPWPTLASVVVGVLAVSVSLVFLNGRPKYSATCRVRANNQPLFTLSFPYFAQFIGQPIAVGPSLATFARALSDRTSVFTPVIVDSPSSLLSYIQDNYADSLQGGIYVDNSTEKASFAWWIQAGSFSGLSTLNAISNTLFDNKLAAKGVPASQSTGIRITTSYRGFDSPHYGQLGNSLKFLIFFGVAMCVMFAFAALYPTSERLRDVKALHFSNGMTPFSLHMGHLLFEIPTTGFIAVVITILYRAIIPNVVHSIGIFFVVLWLYGIAATLLSFIVALFARSQLAAFAFAAGIQAVLFLLYVVAYLVTLTFAPAIDTVTWIKYEHFTISLIPIPIASIARAIIVGLNMFSLACIGPSGTMATHFGDILLYGGPILYLMLHIFFLFAILVWWDSGHQFPKFLQKKRVSTPLEPTSVDTDVGVTEEKVRVFGAQADDALLVQGVSKSYGTLQAVDNVSFGVARDEVFALLGPNSAGKSTTYGLIRGEVKPDNGDVLVGQKSITKQRNAARANLGVCPQFDAMDALSVRQHLTFYAKVKGIPRAAIHENVDVLIAAVSLTPFADRLARKLSGGNKRKLSLAIAMIGNPDVLLIDEASSGMDIGAKRKIWETLTTFMPGRAVVITTHSMEEADALASRVGIIAKRMLAIGELTAIRKRYGDHYEVAIICEHDIDAAIIEARCEEIRHFMLQRFPGSTLDGGRVYHGHLRFKIPISGSVAELFDVLEDKKFSLRIENYGIQRASLEAAFLRLIKQHNIVEEGYESAPAEP